ncbi:hypothetical protein J3E68DRAFT_92176 [Trichoderma sp. SZMC 28012]
MQNLAPLEEARARRFQRASSHHHIDYMPSYTLLNSVIPLALIVLNTIRSSMGFKHGSYSVWAYYQTFPTTNSSNQEAFGTRSIIGQGSSERQSIVPLVNAHPLYCSAKLPFASTDEIGHKQRPPQPQPGLRENVSLLVPSTVPSVLVTGSAAFPNQPSGERMHESSGGLLRAGWNAQLRVERAESECLYRGLGIDTETLPSGFLGLNEQANRRWQGRPQLIA